MYREEIKKITIVDAGFLNISNGSLLHDVPHYESLDALVLNHHSKPKSNSIENVVITMKKSIWFSTFGQHLPQLEHLIGLTWPRLCLFLPPFLRLKVYNNNNDWWWWANSIYESNLTKERETIENIPSSLRRGCCDWDSSFPWVVSWKAAARVSLFLSMID